MATVDALVPFQAFRTDNQIVLAPKPLRRSMGKTWRRMASRLTKSLELKAALGEILAEDGAGNFTVQQVQYKTVKKMGVCFDSCNNRNVFVFFHKSLQRMLMKRCIKKGQVLAKGRRRRRPVTRGQRFQLTSSCSIADEWRETTCMWNEDSWPLKYTLIHQKKSR